MSYLQSASKKSGACIQNGEGLHLPVMRSEVLAGLFVQPDGVYLDATFGRGGHSGALLKLLSDNGRLLVLDRDERAIETAKQMAKQDARISVFKTPFSHVREALGGADAEESIDGVLFDLGVSSPQLDEAERGFSFREDGPLDMRMDCSTGATASDWLRRASEEELRFVLEAYGEERHAAVLAQSLCQARVQKPITTTKQLADVVLRTVPEWQRNHHPATLVFQAIRIHINDEYAQIKQGVSQAIGLLKPNGRIAVLSYHSLEHKWVSQVIKDTVSQARALSSPSAFRMRKVGVAQKSSREEVKVNPRSRSAMLRVWEKVC